MNFFAEVLKIQKDGILSVNEIIAIAIGVVVLLIVLAMLKTPFMDLMNRIIHGRKKTIFRHRKNQYKTRIGKKSKSSSKHKDI